MSANEETQFFTKELAEKITETARASLPISMWESKEVVERAVMLGFLHGQLKGSSEADKVMLHLCWNTCIDHGGTFIPTQHQMERATKPINALLEKGYFQDDPNSINSSFWIMAAGEETESKEYFSKDIESYQELNSILDDFFQS